MPIDDDMLERRPGSETHTHYHLHLEKGAEPAPAGSQESGGSADRKSEQPEKDAKNDGNGGQKDGEKEGEDGKEGGEEKPAPKKSKTPLIILACVVVVVAIVSFIVWFLRRNDESTDDAYTDGNTITMAPKVSGYVTELYVDDNTPVHKGDLLLRIEQDDYQATQAQNAAALASAKAQLDSARVAYDIAKVQYPAQLTAAKAAEKAAEASMKQAQASHKRQHEVDQRATTQENIDSADYQSVNTASNVQNARSNVAIAELVPEQLQSAAANVKQREAAVIQAEATLKQSDLNVGYTEIRSPSDGFITKRNVHQGSYLSAGTTMFLIVTPDVWVTANFKEAQLGRMRPGDQVDIQVDAYSSLKLSGHVQSVQMGSGSVFSAFPTENATGNYVKIVQRVPVKILIDRGLDPKAPLPLGLSVTPVVHLRD